jgi:short-subunit dehydrogenase
MDVVIASSNVEKLNAAAARLRDTAERRVQALRCDVSDRDQVRDLADRVEAEFGRVDLLCANAGATTRGEYVDHRDEDWDWALAVNLRGVTNCIQAFYPAMAARGEGAILITGSQTAFAPDWVLGHGPYVAAKAAVHALALALRAEAAERGVDVSLLVPAATQTDIAQNARRVPADSGAMRMRADAPSGLPPLYLSAEEVAARAISGLKANDPIIVTHAGMRPLAQDYCDRIMAAYTIAEHWPSAH